MDCTRCGVATESLQAKLCAPCRQEREEMARPRQPINRDLRDWVIRRGGGRCVDCWSDEGLRVDHIIPHCEGGLTDPDNLQALCNECNSNVNKGSTNFHGPLRSRLLSETPFTVYQPLVREFGLLAGTVLSRLVAQPGHLRVLGTLVHIPTFALEMGISEEVLRSVLGELHDRGVVLGTIENTNSDYPRGPGWELVCLCDSWAVGNSTGRPGVRA